ncbi:SDR family oxidoreductase [Pseudomonas sp. JV241A]|uniref:SDR family NAD(P)-dependent oxidoreductase n=1 Tax=Pseudomonas sp. JV241A TaxID=2078785 RepID=UPI00100CDD3C|nr:SDR family oxidoreductase [Pseudomonas sp. JV241A]SPO68696.1 Short chain dehydrogenase/reductase family oxidoreductase [Pseudomonas sp. JV241A]
MSEPIARKVWVTGASSGLGLALVQQLLEQGWKVAASGRASPELTGLSQLNPEQLLLLDGNLDDGVQAAQAGQQLQAHWGALDCLLVNAGTCDYLDASLSPTAIFEAIASSNLSASVHCLNVAVPLLEKGQAPQVLAVLSRYSALQLYEPSQPATPSNNLAEVFRAERQNLQSKGIDLTLVAPQALKVPLVGVQVMPEQWTPESAADVIVQRLPERAPELLLEALNLNSLWPLPERPSSPV